MTERQRRTLAVSAAKIGLAGAIIAGGALTFGGQAAADPTPSGPGTPATPAPGQPVVDTAAAPVGPPPPPPAGPPPVPEVQNPAYGAGQTPGQLGYLRDIWHTFHSGNPVDGLTAPAEDAPGPPPGAGPAPKLPPGYISTNSPESNGPPVAPPAQGGPPLPPGYYPLNGPPPPGYFDPAPPPLITPVAPPP